MIFVRQAKKAGVELVPGTEMGNRKKKGISGEIFPLGKKNLKAITHCKVLLSPLFDLLLVSFILRAQDRL